MTIKQRTALLALSLLIFGATSGRAQKAECTDPLPAHDYSTAGYHGGTVPIPYGQRAATVKFDTGRFTIDSLIALADGAVLRGSGRDQTILYFPKGLKGLGIPCGHKGVDCYDWANGVVRAEGKEIGIEDLTIEFPEHEWAHYKGDKSHGYNGVALSGCTDCWVKNVSIRNCDSGMFVQDSSAHVTIDGLHVYVNPVVKSHLHIAISSFSNNNLVTNFRIYGSSFHGLTANWGSYSNVFANGWGESIRIEPDHNCNGVGGTTSCCPDIMYSNIQGTVESVQTKDRAGNMLQTVLWNVGERKRCPQDAYAAQVKKKKTQ
jgi:hypothetical protein